MTQQSETPLKITYLSFDRNLIPDRLVLLQESQNHVPTLSRSSRPVGLKL